MWAFAKGLFYFLAGTLSSTGLAPIFYVSFGVGILTAQVNQLPTSWQNGPSTVVGDLRFHEFTSKVFANKRMIRVLVPPGYDQSINRNKRYPVLYLNDGQNLFDLRTSEFNPMEWQVDEVVERLLTKKVIPPIIIVGIDSAGRRMRFNEYFPYADEFLAPPMPSPEGDKYPEFLIKEVIPFVNSRYRTELEAESTGIGGSSAGAVAALYAVMKSPGSFGRLLMESPSLYISDGQLLKDSWVVKRWPSRIYLGVGINEGGRANCDPKDLRHEAVTDLQQLEQIIRKTDRHKPHLKLEIEPCAVHNEAAWARRLPKAIEFLYGSKKE